MTDSGAQVVFLFPGQGAQQVGMCRELVEQLPAAGELFERASGLLGYDLLAVCLNGPPEMLDSTQYSQPALFVASLAALEKLRREQPEVVHSCVATAGLSLGEYTALVFAGALDFETGLQVVQQRGLAMQAASDREPSGMVSILGLEREVVERLCQESAPNPSGGDRQVLQIANYLCPGNIVVSGHAEACNRIAQAASDEGAMKVIPLAVAGAFHTRLMQPAVEALQLALSQATIRTPNLPVYSNVDAQPHRDPESIRTILARQVTQPVLWEDSMRRLLDQGITTFYEVGPGRVLRGLLKRIQRKATCHGVLDA